MSQQFFNFAIMFIFACIAIASLCFFPRFMNSISRKIDIANRKKKEEENKKKGKKKSAPKKKSNPSPSQPDPDPDLVLDED